VDLDSSYTWLSEQDNRGVTLRWPETLPIFSLLGIPQVEDKINTGCFHHEL
jgi:hypothetical protein